MPAVTAEDRERIEFGAVGIDDRVAVRPQQVAEQALFGGTVRRHIAVIVEMIARQIGEGGRTDRDTVEAVLREAVARRLDRGVLDTLCRQFGEIAVQGDRVGRRQRTGATPGGQDKAERAEACRSKAKPCPDLAGEMNDRSLAVGAGHGRDRPRLPAMEAGG